MKRSTAAVCGISRILFAAGVFCWFFYFFTVITGPETADLSVLVPIIPIALSYCAGVIASRRGIKVLVYILIQIILCAAGIFLLQLAIRSVPDVFELRLTSSIALAVSMAVCAKTAASEINGTQIVHRFDAGLVLCAVLLLADHYLKASYGSTALTVLGASMLMLLLSLAMMRSEKDAALGSAAGRALPVILLILIAFAAGTFAVLGSGAAHGVSSAIISVIRGFLGLIASAATFLWSKWEAFCGWLASLFEPGESVPINIVVPEDAQDVLEISEPSQTSVIVLYVLTALFAAGIIAAFIYAIRKTRLRRTGQGRLNNRLAVRKGGTADGLRKYLSELAARIRYRVDCIRFRNTPAGLLAWCERHVSRAGRKLPSESGPQFLLRLAESQDGGSSDALRTLAALLEKAFYSTAHAEADPALCSAVRKCRF